MPTYCTDLARPYLYRLTCHRTLVSFLVTMKFLCSVFLAAILGSSAAAPAPVDGFVFPKENRRDKKLEPIITPPRLPVLEHLERDPSTLLPHEVRQVSKSAGPRSKTVKPRFGFGGGYSIAPSGTGGLTGTISSSASGAGASQSASQSFSFGFNEGFSASHSASQSSSFSSNGFGGGFSGSQASSQSGSFGGGSVSGAQSSAASLAGGGNAASQSASSAFGFNSLNGFQHKPPVVYDEVNFGEDLLDIRHRGNFKPNQFPFGGPGRSIGAAAARVTSSGPSSRRGGGDDWLAILVSD